MSGVDLIRRIACVASAALALASGTAFAQEWPAAKPVRVIVPFATGGSADVFGRLVAQRLQEALGQSFVVENRPGAGSIIGTDAAAKSAPDGYTLLVMSNTHTVNESLIPNKPFQLMRDFVGVAPINASDLVLVARSGLPSAQVADVLRAARAKPDGMTYASSGPGTPYHMAGELLKAMAGVKIVHVPYKGSAQAHTDLIGGQVDVNFDTITALMPHIRAGRLRPLATSSLNRTPFAPDVPTVAEQGVPGFEGGAWLGFVAAAATPRPIVERLNRELNQILEEPDTRRRMSDAGSEILKTTPEEFAAFIRTEHAKWARVVRESGTKLD